MNSSYKIALLFACILFVFCVVYYININADKTEVAESGEPTAVTQTENTSTSTVKKASNTNRTAAGSSSRRTLSGNSLSSSTSSATRRTLPANSSTSSTSNRSTSNSVRELLNRSRRSSNVGGGVNATSGAVSNTTTSRSATSATSRTNTSASRVTAAPSRPTSTRTSTNSRGLTLGEKPSGATATPTARTRPVATPSTTGRTIPTRVNRPAPPLGSSSANTTAARTTASRNTTATTTRRPATTRPTTTVAAKQYTVQSGDSMYKISVKVFGTPRYFKEIAKANPTVDPKRIKPGMKLNLPDINKLKAAEAARTKSKHRNVNTQHESLNTGQQRESAYGQSRRITFKYLKEILRNPQPLA